MNTLSMFYRYTKVGWLLIATLLLLFGCNRIKQDPDPTPLPIPTVLPTLVTTSYSPGNMVSYRIDSLVPRLGKAYEFSFRQPVYGQLGVEDNRIVYTPPLPSVVWTVDSGQYTICQDGTCGSGWIKVEKAADPATCVQQPIVYRLVSALGQLQFPLPAGAQLTQFSAENYTLDSVNGQLLRYLAGGSLTNYGYDFVAYRYQLNGRCHEVRVSIYVGDSCQAGARDTTISASGGTAFIAEAHLLRNARGCRGQVANGTFSTKALTTGRVFTKYGILADTLVGGSKGFYYRRQQAGTLPDSAAYYYTSGDGNERITRATLTIKL